MAYVTINVDMDKKCAECGKGGAAGSGVCLSCAAKAMDLKRQMKSPQGRALQERFRNSLPKPGEAIKRP